MSLEKKKSLGKIVTQQMALTNRLGILKRKGGKGRLRGSCRKIITDIKVHPPSWLIKGIKVKRCNRPMYRKSYSYIASRVASLRKLSV